MVGLQVGRGMRAEVVVGRALMKERHQTRGAHPGKERRDEGRGKGRDGQGRLRGGEAEAALDGGGRLVEVEND